LSLQIYRLSRWTASVLVSNSGDHTLSFSPSATLYINSAEVNGLSDNEIWDLETRTDAGEPEPFVIKGGESKLIFFVSSDLVGRDPQSSEQLIKTGASKCFVVLHPLANPWSHGADVETPLSAFGLSPKGAQLSQEQLAAHFARH
jgi:hypothetical protein